MGITREKFCVTVLTQPWDLCNILQCLLADFQLGIQQDQFTSIVTIIYVNTKQIPELQRSHVYMKDPEYTVRVIQQMMEDAHHKLQVCIPLCNSLEKYVVKYF